MTVPNALHWRLLQTLKLLTSPTGGGAAPTGGAVMSPARLPGRASSSRTRTRSAASNSAAAAPGDGKSSSAETAGLGAGSAELCTVGELLRKRYPPWTPVEDRTPLVDARTMRY